MSKPKYQRLTRARARSVVAVAFVARASLWLADDQLLSVETGGFVENYKRFYFRDIQSFTLQKTSEATIINVVLAFVILLTIASGISIMDDGAKIFLFILTGFFGLILLINLLKGSTCRCFLRTAVQMEELPSLRRVSRARKILARLHPLITVAQGGELSAQMIAEFLQEPDTPPAPAAPDDPNLPPILG